MSRRERFGEFEIVFDEAGGNTARALPVVLLNPFPLDRRVWAGTVPPLVEAGCRVVTLDYPGFGELPSLSPSAPAPKPSTTIARIGDVVLALADRLRIERLVVVGMSMGGYVALALAAQAPRRLAGLVLADTRADADTPAARQSRADALATIQNQGVDAYLERALPRLLAPDAAPAMLARVQAVAERRAPTLTAGIVALRDRPDRTGELGRLTCPTLVLCGERDQISPPPVMREMAAAIPGARLVEIPGAGHLSHLEAPEPFNRALREFLTHISVAHMASDGVTS